MELDGVELQGVEVRREWRSIDLLITCRDPSFVVAIENKVDSAEHSDQLQRYEKIVREQFPDQRKQFVFLTREGEETSDEDWVPYSYTDIHRVLKRVRDANAGGIGDDVLAFLDHYLNLIGTRFMDDPIDELCQRIEIRERIIPRPIRDPEELGFRHSFRKISPQWATIYKRVLKIDPSQDSDFNDVVRKARGALNDLKERMERALPALRPIIAEWEAKRLQS